MFTTKTKLNVDFYTRPARASVWTPQTAPCHFHFLFILPRGYLN